MPELATIAETLDMAAHSAQATPQLVEPLTVDEAYDVQAQSLERRYGRGERRIGVKMGFTSRAKMVQMNVDEMIWGRLTDQMLVEEGGSVSLTRFVHPRAEPEIAFLLGEDLSQGATALQAQRAIAAVGPAIEIIDSRYQDFKFSLTDVIADNSSSSGVVIGAWDTAVGGLSNLGMVLSVNGRPAQIGSSAAILGHPVRALVAAARLTAERGEALNAGDIVLAGAATAAVALSAGDHVRLEAQGLGRVSFEVTD